MTLAKCYMIFVTLICVILISILLYERASPIFSFKLRFASHRTSGSTNAAAEIHPEYYRHVLPKRWRRETYPCFKGIFKNVLVVVTYNSPFYDNIDIINQMYDKVFGKVVHCGIEGNKNDGKRPDIVADVANGHRGYVCMARAIDKYPGFEGYLYVNDDMLVNWWRLLDFDRNKVWQGPATVEFDQDAYGEIINKGWMWWEYPIGLPACRKSYERLQHIAEEENDFNAKTALEIYLKNGNGQPRCGKGWSDFFYVPKRVAKTAQRLLEIYDENKLFLEMAVMNVLHALDEKKNFEIVKGIFLPDLWLNNPADGKEFWGVYNATITFVHPFKYGFKDFAAMNKALVKHWILDINKSLTSC